MSRLSQIITKAATGEMAAFASLVETELRARVRRQIGAVRPTVFKEHAARGGEAQFRLAHGLKVHRHPVATDDNFRSDLGRATRPADYQETGTEEHADPMGVPALLKDITIRGTGANQIGYDDSMSMSAKEFTDFVDDEELHTEAIQSVFRRQLEDRDAGEYDRRVARAELREAVSKMVPSFQRKSGVTVGSPVVAEVVRHMIERLESL